MTTPATFLPYALVALGTASAAVGQPVPVPWAEDFDGYTPGLLTPQSTWEPWDLQPGADGFVVSANAARSSPHALAITAFNDAVQRYVGPSGSSPVPMDLYEYSLWVWVPSTNTDAQFFILLNTYDHCGSLACKNFSNQMAFDATNGLYTDLDVGGSVPLVTDRWMRVRVVIDLVNDTAENYYDGALVSTKSWTASVGPPGALDIQAVDLYGNGSSSFVYYDDMALKTIEARGACCLTDGTCVDDNGQGISQQDCQSQGGRYQGHGSSCGEVSCPAQISCQVNPSSAQCGNMHCWELNAPALFRGDTTGLPNTCSIFSQGPDQTFVVRIPWTGEWTISLCGSSFNTDLYVWDASLHDCCTFPTGEPGFWFNSDACGTQSEIVFDGRGGNPPPLPAGDYIVTVDGESAGAFGRFSLNVTGPCLVEHDPNGIAEGEACGEDLNGGCNMVTPTWTPLAIDAGETLVVNGFCWSDGQSRDNDWFDLTVGAGVTEVVMDVTAEFELLAGQIGSSGPDPALHCANPNLFILPGTIVDACQTARVNLDLTRVDPQGRPAIWPRVSPTFGTIATCGVTDRYVMTLTATGGGGCPPPCIGDTNGDSVVDVQDLLVLLAAWGPNPGHAADFNCDDVVDVQDLLALLANWGPCP